MCDVKKRRRKPFRWAELLPCPGSWFKWGKAALRAWGIKVKARGVWAPAACAHTVSTSGSPYPRGVKNACFCGKACSGMTHTLFSWDDRHFRGTVTALAAVLLNAEVHTHQIQMHRYLEVSNSGRKGAELCAALVWSGTGIPVQLSVAAPSCATSLNHAVTFQDKSTCLFLYPFPLQKQGEKKNFRVKRHTSNERDEF